MAKEGVQAETPSVRELSRLERLPTRRIILTVLTVAIAVVVGGGIYKTLTLPEAERLGWSFWANLLVIGLALGAVYALIALGYTLVYGILRMINFAHGEVFMAGAFGSYFFATAYAESGFLNAHPWEALGILFLVGMGVSTGIAVLLERVAYRPLRNAPRLVPLITAIGASLFLQNSFQGFFGSQTRGYPRPSLLDGTIQVGKVSFDKIDPVVIVTAITVMVALQIFVKRTKTGKSMRAVAQDREIASLMGIDVDRVVVTTFILGGMLAGIAGVLYALTFGQVGATMGFLPGIAAFTAAVLGGIGSVPGAAIGGLILGVAESVGPYLLLSGVHVPSPFELRGVVTFSILVLVLIFRPGGILGTGEAEKV
ncbi:MAG: branched-chain amino acid ABC transporter permease [Actinomycetota bacterium]